MAGVVRLEAPTGCSGESQFLGFESDAGSIEHGILNYA